MHQELAITSDVDRVSHAMRTDKRHRAGKPMEASERDTGFQLEGT